MAPPEPLDKLLAKTISSIDPDSDADSDVEDVASSVSELTQLPSPYHLPRITTSDPTSEDPTHLSITDEEKELRLSGSLPPFSLESRPFLAAVFAALDYTDNDYYQLFSLCLIYAMQVQLLASCLLHPAQ